MKKILVTATLGLAMIFPSTILAEVGGEKTRTIGCINDSIIAYFPFSPSWSDVSHLVFITKPEIKVSSLEATINGQDKAVEYKNFGSFYRARVQLPENEDDISAIFNVGTIGAECNAPILYTFERA